MPRPEDLPGTDVLTIEDQEIPVRDGAKIGIRIYKPKSVQPQAPLVFVTHGGGWVIGVHGAEETMNKYIAGRNGAVVISVDYRMAPEFKFPYAVNDSLDALKWCIENADTLGIDKNRIILAGSSAGGNLAFILSQIALDEKINGIVGVIAGNPVTCHPAFFPKAHFELDSFETNADAPGLNKERMMWFWDLYVPDPQPDTLHSPLLAESLSGLPPALILIAGVDPLRDEGIAYADRLKEAGVPVQLEIYSGVPHGWHNITILSKAKKYHDDIRVFVDKTFASKL
ncbi:hypothetical protein NA57DRAFT_71870 [Rhizodiscina lignyota]|uniref:Alpha/beta hydrolase fold-3 domain-containing protein n=1 Tax=Rhizodiscina lignyota TaxID=1504668 RepID=A0A9P4IKL9_9PEZI|nr:hypothetical protein NA57DRAFT_71870 [Rhizodiscina lignyota]